MAYEGGVGGTFKNLWSPDLTTRYGAASASRTASKIFLGIGLFYLLLFAGSAHYSELLARLLAGDAELLLFGSIAALMLSSGLLLRRGRGWPIATVAAILFGLAIIGGGLIMWAIGAPFLAATIGGIRGAKALSKGQFSDDLYETFA
jgi:hypothetical protein